MSRAAGLFLAVAALLSAGACTRSPERTPNASLKVASLPFLSLAPDYIALNEGYFADQGLSVELVSLRRSSDAIPALLSGELDVLPAAIGAPHLNAVAKGAKLRVVAGRNHLDPAGCDYVALVTRRELLDSGRLQGTSLRGLRFSFKRASVWGYVVDTLLREHGLSLEDVENLDLPDVAEADALRRGSVDVAVMTEPWLTRIQDYDDLVIWTNAQSIIPELQYTGVLFGPRLLVEAPELGERYMIAHLRAVREFDRGKTDNNVDLIARFTGLDRSLVARACWPTPPVDGRFRNEGFDGFQEWALAQGLLDAHVPLEQFWEPRFVEHAAAVLQAPQP